jgi:hypothetical protein
MARKQTERRPATLGKVLLIHGVIKKRGEKERFFKMAPSLLNYAVSQIREYVPWTPAGKAYWNTACSTFLQGTDALLL